MSIVCCRNIADINILVIWLGFILFIILFMLIFFLFKLLLEILLYVIVEKYYLMFLCFIMGN